ncbi:disease resistance protein Roq1-like [Capsicum annuum]|nr:disease resistance protein Roq1-like [Capsicum annuum]
MELEFCKKVKDKYNELNDLASNHGGGYDSLVSTFDWGKEMIKYIRRESPNPHGKSWTEAKRIFVVMNMYGIYYRAVEILLREGKFKVYDCNKPAINKFDLNSCCFIVTFRDEADCIKKVVDYISLNTISPVSESLVGTQIDKVISLLHLKSDHVCSAGIWGMSGIGKTEIASVIYERYRHQFEAYCFLDDVGEMYRKKGLTWLQKSLICKLLGKKMIVTSERDGAIILKNALRWKKVLLILDNVDHLSQLELIFGGTEWFSRGSRILITTRDKHMIITHVKEDKVYEVLLLSETEALELFCMHAFKRKFPERDFEELSSVVVTYADGLSLALKVLGSSLYGRNKEQCRHIIDRLKKIPHDLGKLKIGLDGLNKDEMRTFLDIACLCNHESRYYVELILRSCGIHLIGISYLVEKSLLCIRDYSFEMQSLICQMGLNVLREEYANDRIWLIYEVHDLFAGKLKAEKVESLRIPKGYRFEDDHVNHNKVFKRMQSLQVLIFTHRTICPESTITSLPSNLQWVEWPNYASCSLPEGFEPSHFVGLCLLGSRLVELWPIPKKLSNLKHLDLSESLGLTKTPNFGDMPNLETLILWKCENLEEVHPSLGHCRMLTYLSLRGCVKLEKLPKFVCMESLEILHLEKCTHLKRFPKICEDMRRLSMLDVGSPWIRNLSPALSGLSYLKLKGCEVLESIPEAFRNLERLHISGCNKLATLPNSLFESQQWIFLYIRKCSGLVELPVSLGIQKNLAVLCIAEYTFPEINRDVHCLKSFTLESTGIRELPSSIGNLRGLEFLSLKGCEDLVYLPNSLRNLTNLQWLILRGCKKFPENIDDMQQLETLEARETAIPQPAPPPSIAKLGKLKELMLSHEQFQHSSSFVLHQVSSDLCNLNILGGLPEDLGSLQSLVRLDVSGSYISCLPKSINKLSRLNHLNVQFCQNLNELPRELPSNLTELFADYHLALKSIDDLLNKCLKPRML